MRSGHWTPRDKNSRSINNDADDDDDVDYDQDIDDTLHADTNQSNILIKYRETEYYQNIVFYCSISFGLIRLHRCEHTAIWIRDLADDSGKQEKTRGGTTQVAEEKSSCVMARQNHKQKYKGKDGT